MKTNPPTSIYPDTVTVSVYADPATRSEHKPAAAALDEFIRCGWCQILWSAVLDEENSEARSQHAALAMARLNSWKGHRRLIRRSLGTCVRLGLSYLQEAGLDIRDEGKGVHHMLHGLGTPSRLVFDAAHYAAASLGAAQVFLTANLKDFTTGPRPSPIIAGARKVNLAAGHCMPEVITPTAFAARMFQRGGEGKNPPRHLTKPPAGYPARAFGMDYWTRVLYAKFQLRSLRLFYPAAAAKIISAKHWKVKL
jgi:hypothetical protein